MRYALFLLLILSLLNPRLTYAGAWLQPKNQGLYIAQTGYYFTNHYFDRASKRNTQPAFQKYEFQPYIEYGLLENMTIGATAYAERVQQSQATNTGVADPELFLRTQIWSDATQRISLQPLIKFQSYFTKNGTPRGGSSSTDFELSALYGRNLNLLSPHDYLDVRTGYRLRGNQLHNQLRADAALGIEIADQWFLTPAIRTITATHISDTASFSENGDQDFDLAKIEVGVTYRYSPTQTAGVTIFNHIYGTQTGDGMGAILSLGQGF